MTRLVERHVDLAVVGAGIVGLAHAVDALDRGLSVAIVERDARPCGASLRNFGHVFVTGQSGDALDYALKARERWLRLARNASFWAAESGTLVVARWPEELAVLEEFAARRLSPAGVLSPAETLGVAPVGAEELLGGLWTPLDVRVDPREAVPALLAWLARQPGVSFHWGTTAFEVGAGWLSTSRGELEADAIVIAVGHDLDTLLPETAEEAGVRRCTLQMLRVAAPHAEPIRPALATGLALLRYSGFADCPSLPDLRARYEHERPELVQHEVNLLVTQQPDGDLILGDTHHYAPVGDPFRPEQLDALLLQEGRRLLGATELTVRERWLGVYAHALGREFLVTSPWPGVRAVTVTSGIGMTTALGLATVVLDDLVHHAHTTV